MLPPATRLGDPPDYHRLDEYIFQNLCRDLFDAEPEVAMCEVYGERGESQDGIDLFAYRAGNDGIEVGQCKCYRDFPPARIRQASDEFFRHWTDVWSTENVKRFILFVACTVSNRPRQNEIRRQRERFAGYNIEYEVWSAPKITNKLRGQPGVVASYFQPPEYWVKVLCGSTLPGSMWESSSITTVQVTASQLLLRQFDELSSLISADAEAQLEEIRQAWRSGDTRRTETWMANIKAYRWDLLSDAVKAKLLIFEGSLTLNADDVEKAQLLADEANELLATDGECRLRALIAHRKGDDEGALLFLDGLLDPDSNNLRAAILLDARRMEEGYLIANDLARKGAGNAETYRILSLVALSKRQMEQSQLYIQKAIELQPTWVAIRYAAAVINYYSGLSPAALPGQLVAWPNPVDWILVKRDSESLRRFASAASTFAELVGHGGNVAIDQMRLRHWQLASLANLPDKQQEAIDLCKMMLTEDPTSYPAILWAVARNWDIDFAPCERALDRKLGEGKAEVSDVLALAHCYYRFRRGSKVINLLDRAKAIFETQKAVGAWQMSYVEALLTEGEFDTARQLIETVQDDIRIEAEALLLGSWAEHDGNWEQLSEYYGASFERTGDRLLLMAHCEAEARRGRWIEVAKHADELLESIATSGILRLLVFAKYHLRSFQECLDLIDTHSNWFNNARLPLEFRQIRIACLRALGNLPNAVLDAEDLAKEDPSVQNLSNLAGLYIDLGDSKKLMVLARGLLANPDVPVDLLITLAALLRGEDIALAQALWYQVVSQDISDELVSPVFALAFELGIEHSEKLMQLQSRVFELGRERRSGVFAVESSQVMDILRERREHLEFLFGQYQRGNAPIHVIADQIGWPLVDPYHSRLARNEQHPDPLRQPMLFARHGGRIDTESFIQFAAPWKLNLDITALLLAEHMGILATVERALAPLRIPSSTMAALLYMEDRLQQHQPDRIRAAQEVLRCIQDRRISVADESSGSTRIDPTLEQELGHDVASLFTMAVSHDGFLCTFLPPVKNDLSGEFSILPEETLTYLVNAGNVVQSLFDEGVISKTALDNALAILGMEGRSIPGFGAPRLGTFLYCLGSVAQLLAKAEVLLPVCRYFHVVLVATDVNLLQLEVDAFLDAHETVLWLRNLRDHLRNGIETGSFVLIPEHSKMTATVADAELQGPYETSLLTLLAFDPGPNDLIWADDRYCNSFAGRVGVPIIGINEVLGALKSNGMMTEDEYYGALHRLRAANVRFMPPSPDEILFYLKQARVENGRVVETLFLRVLRKYLAAILLQGDLLQHPPLPEGAPSPAGEVFYITHLHRVVTQTLVAIWGEHNAHPEVLHARSEWIWSAVTLDLANMRRMVFSDQLQNDLHLQAMSFTSLLTIGFQLPDNGKAVRNRRLYHDWLYNRVLKKQLMVEPLLAQIVAEQIKDTLAGVYQNLLDKLEDDDRRLVAQAVLQRYFYDLPEEIQLALRNDDEIVARLGIDFEVVTEIGGLIFPKSTFLKAAGQVVNGNTAAVQSIGEPLVWVTFIPSREGIEQCSFSYVDPVSGAERVVLDDRLTLLSTSISQREQVLKEHSYWIDAPQNDLDRIIAEIASMVDPEERLNKLDEHMTSSAAVYYRELESKIGSRSEFAEDDLLPPSASGLLRHFRLGLGSTSSSTLRVEIAKSAEDLLHTLEFVDAVIRLMSLPVPLPDRFIEAIQSLPEDQKRSMCHRLLRKIGSPLTRVHTIYLFLHLSDQIPALRRLANQIAVDTFSNAAKQEFDAFSYVLRWVNDRFVSWSQVNDWPSDLRLAMTWAHADRLFYSFRSAGAPMDWLRDFFGQLLSQEGLRAESLERDSTAVIDIAHPYRLTDFRFMVQGFAYAFADHELSVELRSKLEQEFVARGISDMSRDSLLHRNCLGSFLGQDYCKSTAVLFGDRGISQISHEALQSNLVELVQTQLSQEDVVQQLKSWIWLGVLLGDLEPPDDIQQPLCSGLAGTDFAESSRDDPILSSVALHAASQQLRWQHDENLRLGLRTQLMNSATILAETNASVFTSSLLGFEETRDAMILRMAMIGLTNSLASPPETDIATDFSQLLEQLFMILPEGLHVGATVIQRFFEDLPIDQSKEFARLYLQLRATIESFP